MLPLLLAAPEGRPARLLGQSPSFLMILQNLSSVGWPCVLHDEKGGGPLAGFPSLQVATAAPPAPALRQSSLVLIGSGCVQSWREAARRDLEGSGVPLWDEADAKGSSLAFPKWLHGRDLSAAFWAKAGVEPWQEKLAASFLDGTETMLDGFLELARELHPLFEGMDEEAFRDKVVSQMTKPEIMSLLVKGQRAQAKTAVLKIVGSTTRTL